MKQIKTFYMIPCDKPKEVFADLLSNNLCLGCLQSKEDVESFCKKEKSYFNATDECKKCKKKPIKYKITIELKKA